MTSKNCSLWLSDIPAYYSKKVMTFIQAPHCRSIHKGNSPQTQKYRLEGGSLEVQASPTRNPPCISVPAGIVMRVYIHSVSVNFFFFFGDSFNTFAHFMMGDLRAHLPTPCWVFSSFWPNTTQSLCSTLPIHQISPPETFCLFVSPWKRSSKGNVFLMWKRWNKKVRSTKRHQN